ncbi:MAG: LysM domain-containing protein [Acidimicrobiales bacterium]
MTALLTPQPTPASPWPPSRDRPRLIVIEGGRSRLCAEATFRRRRLAALLVILVVVLGSVAGLRATLAAVTPEARAPSPGSVAPSARAATVAPGDSLWSIARWAQPDGDIRAVVDQLAAAHGPGPLQPGERIALPAG